MDAEALASAQPASKGSPIKAKAKDGHSAEKSRPQSEKGSQPVKEKGGKDKASPLYMTAKGKKPGSDVDDTKKCLKRPALVDSGEAATPVVSGDRDGGSGFSGPRGERGPHKRAKIGTPEEAGGTGAGAAASAATLGFTATGGGDMRGTESEAGVAPAGPRRREGQAVVECIVEARQGQSQVMRDVDLGR